jgi:hypothetical protein
MLRYFIYKIIYQIKEKDLYKLFEDEIVEKFHLKSYKNFYLFLKENINDVKTLYYPPGITEQDAFSAVSELYKPFILNDIQVNEIKIKYEKKFQI